MRTFDAADKSDQTELARLEAPGWMVAQLGLNPDYVLWGPHEDYMTAESGWDAPIICGSWSKFGPWTLNELNEVVHFYFSIERPERDCENCGGSGTHPDAQWITESFYRHSSPFTRPDDSERRVKALLKRWGCSFSPGVLGRGTFPPNEVVNRYGKPFLECCVSILENDGHWNDSITDDEAAALVREGRGRLDKLQTAADFNRAQRVGGIGSHDAINRWILCRARCERLGVPVECPVCAGHGGLFTGPARLDLALWVLHPRKGCSRGVEVQNLNESELPAVYVFLRQAADRNAQRFAKIPIAKAEAR